MMQFRERSDAEEKRIINKNNNNNKACQPWLLHQGLQRHQNQQPRIHLSMWHSVELCVPHQGPNEL